MLLADDSVTIQRVVELTFSGEDIEVVTVSDGEQAIARISADPPDIVLADIAMPKKNGYEVAAFVKDHPALASVPVLLLAGAFEPVDEDRARRVKCDGVLVKPFETHEVITRVRELIERERPAQPVVPASSEPVVVRVIEAPTPIAISTPAQPPQPVAAPPPAPQAPAAVPSPAPVAAPSPAPPAAPAAAASTSDNESLDAYFDRLDVAFAARAQNQPRPFPHLAPPSPERNESAGAPPGRAEAGAGSRSVIADLFQQLFEVEQGERDADSIRIPEQIERIRRSNRIE